MKLEGMEEYCPEHWEQMDMSQELYRMIRLPRYSQEFLDVEKLISGSYYEYIQNIFMLQNPFVYTKFKLKEFEFGQRAPYEIKLLYHDTCQTNVDSIASYNFDWRYGTRYMFGPGVYFSKSPKSANRHSSKRNGRYRTMCVAEVLIQNVQEIEGEEVFLPDMGYDTVLSHGGSTYVKYFDNEFYPTYFVDYINAN